MRFTTREQARSEIFRFLEGFYNLRRRHSALGYRPPSTPEKRTFQLCLDTRIDITAPLGDDGSDTTAHSCSVVASAVTSTVHHSVATLGIVVEHGGWGDRYDSERGCF